MTLTEDTPPRPCDYCGGWNIVDDGFLPRCQDADCTGEVDAMIASGKPHSFAAFLAALFDGDDTDIPLDIPLNWDDL